MSEHGDSAQVPRKLLLLHGSRQVGEILLGRIEKLRKKLRKMYNLEFVAPDGPFLHPEDKGMRQWWNREGNDYFGLREKTLEFIQSIWNKNDGLEGIVGFSQGARLAHLLVQCHESTVQPLRLKGLRYVIMCSGYEAPPPISGLEERKLCTPSLHVWGAKDKLIPPEQSRAVMKDYQNAVHHEHDGGHHVPMKAFDVQIYTEFIANYAKVEENPHKWPSSLHADDPVLHALSETPSEEAMMAQQDEVEALSAMFPDELKMYSKKVGVVYEFPIVYRIDLIKTTEGMWPPHPISLEVSYPHDYPESVIAQIKLIHENNMMEFTSKQIQACHQAISDAAETEIGMPTVLTCVYAAREFFESGSMATVTDITQEDPHGLADADKEYEKKHASVIRPASKERIQLCILQGLQIAQLVCKKLHTIEANTTAYKMVLNQCHGGIWKYTCGLVGKPSAGSKYDFFFSNYFACPVSLLKAMVVLSSLPFFYEESTFFNAATAFARQRNDAGSAIGGATMAPHPFTTIDPNVGFCLVPAPEGSCPEDGISIENIGCSHGRDHLGRRLIPVILKDVAGLVPGAYQGRGRGNKFLNDLTEADVLIHVVDASGTADTEGHVVGKEDGASHPLEDLAWILNEMVEWVFNNVVYKWNRIQRRGRDKLFDMFSGYGQSRSTTQEVFFGVQKYMEDVEQKEGALEKLEEWDEGDLYRLVSAFLGTRFPMALALNKKDLPSSVDFLDKVKESLPIHGAHVGVPLSARAEMNYMKSHMIQENPSSGASIPEGVWECLKSAVALREPILVFPVSDMISYAPLPGMIKFATGDASLPNSGMIRCLVAAAGSAPSLWQNGCYTASLSDKMKLRDAVMMKIGSTVEDLFHSLKRMGVLGGEFVRAEGAGEIGEKPRLIPKLEILNRSNRILKIMTNKRQEWQRK
eukprot:CAMPEP_0194205756 /NCGR_PEP_ID=MMETSP0156-20130528/4969_1 /TAXON_ID=33649 /ORGANISM="Thalassionema nitzschioides, Strain L26-B" /LENGTH=921 /DNA_ID=CAMNT_0038932119 /DNA_START=41 /DNA_END=2807 /DNA_ORIENTATION=+